MHAHSTLMVCAVQFNSNGKMGMPEFIEFWKLFSLWKVCSRSASAPRARLVLDVRV